MVQPSIRQTAVSRVQAISNSSPSHFLLADLVSPGLLLYTAIVEEESMNLNSLNREILIKLVVIASGIGVLVIFAVELMIFSFWLGDFFGTFM